MKRCKGKYGCKKNLPDSKFLNIKTKNGSHQLKNVCTACVNKRRREIYRENKARARTSAKVYRNSHKDRINAQNRDYYAKQACQAKKESIKKRLEKRKTKKRAVEVLIASEKLCCVCAKPNPFCYWLRMEDEKYRVFHLACRDKARDLGIIPMMGKTKIIDAIRNGGKEKSLTAHNRTNADIERSILNIKRRIFKLKLGRYSDL